MFSGKVVDVGWEGDREIIRIVCGVGSLLGDFLLLLRLCRGF